MKKWYAPGSWLLLAALTSQLIGCAGTARTFSRWTGGGKSGDEIAEIDGSASKAEKGSKTKAEVKVSDSSKSKSKSKSKSDAADESSLADAGSSRPKAVAKPAAPATQKSKELAKAPSAPEAKVAATPKRESGKSPLEEMDDIRPKAAELVNNDPFADFPLSEFATSPVASVEAPIGTAKLSSGVLKPPSANASVAQGTKLTRPAAPKPSGTQVAQASATSGLPEWALEDAPAYREQPAISQTSAFSPEAAAKIQPGQPAPADKRLPATRTVSPSSLAVKPSSLCPEAVGEVRELVKSLDSSNVEDLKRTIHRLGRMQTHAAAAEPGLRALLRHPDGFVRVHAALALVRMQSVGSDVTSTLILGLRSPDPGVRSFAAAVLAEMGPNSADALPALSAALSDPDGYVRLHVAEVLIRHEEWSHPALQALTESLTSGDENIRWLATYSLAELAPQSEDAVAALTQSLRDSAPKVQVGAAYALGEVGPLAASALDELRRCQGSPNAELKAAADYAITQIRP